MTSIPTTLSLSPARRRLIELMQKVNYGRIKGLKVIDGEPVFDPPPSALRTILFCRNNGSNAAISSDGYALKKKVTELFTIFDQEQSLSVQELLVENGLPVRMTVAGTAEGGF